MSNSAAVLSDLAREIDENEKSRRACEVKGLMHGFRIGQLLLEARKVVPHGGFLDWVKANTSVTPRMCQIYMKVAKDPRIQRAIEHEYETVSHLTLTKAVKLAAQPEDRVLAWGKRIADRWRKQEKIKQDWVTCVAQARQALGGSDEEFTSWLISDCDFGTAFAATATQLVKQEYDSDAWTDALLAAFEARRAEERR